MRTGARSIAGLLAALLVVAWTAHALGALAHARRARAEARIAAAPPRLIAARALVAPDAGAAARALARLLADRASATGVRLSLAPARTSGADGLVRLALEAHAGERRLDAFAAAIEAAHGPQVRLVTWSIEGRGAGDPRLTAEAAAPWTPPAPARPIANAAAIRLPDPPSPPPVAIGRALFAGDAPADIRPTGDGPPELAGIAGRLPDDAVALLRLSDGSTRGARRGESVAGWRVTRIDADRIRLARGSEERVLVLPPR